MALRSLTIYVANHLGSNHTSNGTIRPIFLSVSLHGTLQHRLAAMSIVWTTEFAQKSGALPLCRRPRQFAPRGIGQLRAHHAIPISGPRLQIRKRVSMQLWTHHSRPSNGIHFEHAVLPTALHTSTLDLRHCTTSSRYWVHRAGVGFRNSRKRFLATVSITARILPREYDAAEDVASGGKPSYRPTFSMVRLARFPA